ncbi:hypothetical protein WKW79_35850 [Variovorax robiniae]|uniref:Uncharacterized protein n=1 Tax=Variovorax robiniae TaxID=1836199 RepID=A0ABU8XLQ0_9BURK
MWRFKVANRTGVSIPFDRHQRLEKAVTEKLVNAVFLAAQRQPVLAPDAANPATQFEDEVAQPLNPLVLRLAFLDRAPDSREREVVAALERFSDLRRFIQHRQKSDVVTSGDRFHPVSHSLCEISKDEGRGTPSSDRA